MTRPQSHHPQDETVVGVDGGAPAAAAVAWAADQAVALARPLRVVTVVEAGEYGLAFHVPRFGDLLEPLGEPLVRRAVAAAERRQPLLTVTGEVLVGHAATALEQISERVADLVIGVDPRAIVSRILLGSVGHHLAHASRAPLTMVPAVCGSPVPAPPPDPVDRVVVAFGGRSGVGAVTRGFEEADRRRVPLVLVHAETDRSGRDEVRGADRLRAHVGKVEQEHPHVVVTAISRTGTVDDVLDALVVTGDLLVMGLRRRVGPVVDEPLQHPLAHPRVVTILVPDDTRPSPEPSRPGGRGQASASGVA